STHPRPRTGRRAWLPVRQNRSPDSVSPRGCGGFRRGTCTRPCYRHRYPAVSPPRAGQTSDPCRVCVMTAADIADALGAARREGRGWHCRCPLHQGRSLTLRDGDGGSVLVRCWGGCDRLDVLAELRRRGLLNGHTTDYAGASSRKSEREDAVRTARALAIWREARPAGVSHEIVGGSFTAIDIDGVVLGTFDTLREPTRAFPERGGM